MLIGIAGRKRHGKDSVGRFLVERGFHTTAFADPLKRAAALIYGLSYDECYGEANPKLGGVDIRETPLERLDGLTPRFILQRLGTEGCRAIHPQTWVWATERVLTTPASESVQVHDAIGRQWLHTLPPQETPRDWAVTDVRFPNEADCIRRCGGKVLRVKRPSLISTDEHDSERFIDELEVDFDLWNDGTLQDLRDRVMGLGIF